MAEYGCGVSLMQTCAYDKERIKMALQGKLLCGETENGFEYAEASKEECGKYIIEAFDECVFHLREALISSNTLDSMIDMPESKKFKKYMTARETVEKKFAEEFPYPFEDEED